MKYQNYYLAALSGLLSFTALAESKQEEMVVTAHRTAVPSYRVGSSVSVLDSADIEAKGQFSVADLLRTVPGVAVSNTGGIGKQTTLRIRGEEGYRTVVYVDGVKVSDPTGTQISPRLGHLMTSDIERIEVLRGPQGMMYGADAGGVVQITTRQPTEAFEGGLNAEYGRYDTTNLSGSLRGKLDSFSYSLNASDFSTDGFNSRDDDTVLADDDGYDNTSYSAHLQWQATEQLGFDLALRDVDAFNEYDNSFGTSDVANDFEQQTAKLSADLNLERLRQHLSVSTSDVERQIYEDGVKASWGGYYDGTLDQWEYMATLLLSGASELSLGVDLQEQTDHENNKEQDQNGVYVEWRSQLGEDFYYSAGVRHDDNDAFGEFTSYRVTSAYVQQLESGNSLKYRASYGTGFRAPSLYELWYNGDSGWAYGEALTTELDAEESEGFDIGVEWRSAAGHLLELVYFNQEIDNAIDFDVETFSGYLQYDGVSRSKGVELNGELVVSHSLLLYGNATYNDTSDADGNQRVRRPRQVFNLGMQLLLLSDQLRLNADLRGSYDSVDNSGAELDDYETLNLSATYTVVPQFEVYMRGENVFAADYQEISHYNTSKAGVYGGMRLRF